MNYEKEVKKELTQKEINVLKKELKEEYAGLITKETAYKLIYETEIKDSPAIDEDDASIYDLDNFNY